VHLLLSSHRGPDMSDELFWLLMGTAFAAIVGVSAWMIGVL
jgi:hypothetical protein